MARRMSSMSDESEVPNFGAYARAPGTPDSIDNIMNEEFGQEVEVR